MAGLRNMRARRGSKVIRHRDADSSLCQMAIRRYVTLFNRTGPSTELLATGGSMQIFFTNRKAAYLGLVTCFFGVTLAPYQRRTHDTIVTWDAGLLCAPSEQSHCMASAKLRKTNIDGSSAGQRCTTSTRHYNMGAQSRRHVS